MNIFYVNSIDKLMKLLDTCGNFWILRYYIDICIPMKSSSEEWVSGGEDLVLMFDDRDLLQYIFFKNGNLFSRWRP